MYRADAARRTRCSGAEVREGQRRGAPVRRGGAGRGGQNAATGAAVLPSYAYSRAHTAAAQRHSECRAACTHVAASEVDARTGMDRGRVGPGRGGGMAWVRFSHAGANK